MDDKLMQYFKFNQSDLDANRRGVFSREQEKRIYGRSSGAIREKRIAVAVAFPLGLILLGWAAYLISRNTGGADSIVLGCFGSLFLLASVYIFRLSLIREKYFLAKVEGPINIIKENRLIGDHHSVFYELHIGGRTFQVDSSLGNIMMQGEPYAIYYSEGQTNHLAEIRSAELIDKGK